MNHLSPDVKVAETGPETVHLRRRGRPPTLRRTMNQSIVCSNCSADLKFQLIAEAEQLGISLSMYVALALDWNSPEQRREHVDRNFVQYNADRALARQTRIISKISKDIKEDDEESRERERERAMRRLAKAEENLRKLVISQKREAQPPIVVDKLYSDVEFPSPDEVATGELPPVK